MAHYDVFNRLVSVNETTSGTTNYTYRPNGMRQAKIGAVITTHVWDGGNIVADIEGSSVTTYLRGVNLIASVKGSAKNYFLYNAHGDVVLFGGKAYKYDAFGNDLAPNASDANPFRYAGEYFDGETGTYYLRARYYEPKTGRFLSEDPANAGLNWYTYCSGNPVSFIDPSGLAEVELRGYANHYAGAVIGWNDSTKTATVTWNGRTLYVKSTTQNNRNGRLYVDDSLFINMFGYYWFSTPAGAPGSPTTSNVNNYYPDMFEYAQDRADYAIYMMQLSEDDPLLYYAKGFWDNLQGVAPGIAINTAVMTARGADINLARENNPLANIQYTDKVKAQMANTSDNYHSFPIQVDDMGAFGIQSVIIGGDGVARTLVQIPGFLNGTPGVYEYIFDSSGMCNHRLFVPN